jgi:NAD(P) transhydrogenase
VTAAERAGTEERLAERGVLVLRGTARFADPHTIEVERPDGTTTRLHGERILIATGSSPLRPPAFPFGHPRVHDSDEILAIDEVPTALAVIGAGVVGAEYACTFRALGVEVHVLDGRDALLPFLDEEVSAALERAMRARGVEIHWNTVVERCDADAVGPVRLTLSTGAVLSVSDVLVAAGRTSNTADLELGAAGLTPGERGLVPVDGHFRTDQVHIYAAGDVIGPPALAATGMEQARAAVCHAFDLLDKEIAPILPTGIYTIPEASMAGATEQSLKKDGVDYWVGRAPYSIGARGRIIGDETGFLKLLFRRDDMRLLGVHALGEQATELVHVGLVALLHGCDAGFFSRTCFNYPTLGDLYKYAAYDAIVQQHVPGARVLGARTPDP